MVYSLSQSEIETHVAGDSLSVYAYYGQDRTRERKALMEHDVVLTTYGVVASEFNQPVSTKSFAFSTMLFGSVSVNLQPTLASYFLGVVFLILWETMYSVSKSWPIK